MESFRKNLWMENASSVLLEDAHPLIKDKIASGEGVRGQFVDSQVAERILLRGIDIGLCILPIHDGFITTRGDEFVLESLMNDAFREITGCTAMLKPESFDLSVLPDDASMMDLIGYRVLMEALKGMDLLRERPRHILRLSPGHPCGGSLRKEHIKRGTGLKGMKNGKLRMLGDVRFLLMKKKQ